MRQKLHRQWKKVLAVVLSVAMILGVCPDMSGAKAATVQTVTMSGQVYSASYAENYWDVQLGVSPAITVTGWSWNADAWSVPVTIGEAQCTAGVNYVNGNVLDFFIPTSVGNPIDGTKLTIKKGSYDSAGDEGTIRIEKDYVFQWNGSAWNLVPDITYQEVKFTGETYNMTDGEHWNGGFQIDPAITKPADYVWNTDGYTVPVVIDGTDYNANVNIENSSCLNIFVASVNQTKTQGSTYTIKGGSYISGSNKYGITIDEDYTFKWNGSAWSLAPDITYQEVKFTGETYNMTDGEHWNGGFQINPAITKPADYVWNTDGYTVPVVIDGTDYNANVNIENSSCLNIFVASVNQTKTQGSTYTIKGGSYISGSNKYGITIDKDYTFKWNGSAWNLASDITYQEITFGSINVATGYSDDNGWLLYLNPSMKLPGTADSTYFNGLKMTVDGVESEITVWKASHQDTAFIVVPKSVLPKTFTKNTTIVIKAGQADSNDGSDGIRLTSDFTIYANQYGMSSDGFITPPSFTSLTFKGINVATGYSDDNGWLLYLNPSAKLPGTADSTYFNGLKMTVDGVESEITVWKASHQDTAFIVVPKSVLPKTFTKNTKIVIKAGQANSNDGSDGIQLTSDFTIYANQYGMSTKGYIKAPDYKSISFKGLNPATGYDNDNGWLLYLNPSAKLPGTADLTNFSGLKMTVGGVESEITVWKASHQDTAFIVVPKDVLPKTFTKNTKIVIKAGKAISNDGSDGIKLTSDFTIYANQYGMSTEGFYSTPKVIQKGAKLALDRDTAFGGNESGLYLTTNDKFPTDDTWGTKIKAVSYDDNSGIFLNGKKIPEAILVRYADGRLFVGLQDSGITAKDKDKVTIKGKFILNNQIVNFGSVSYYFNGKTWGTKYEKAKPETYKKFTVNDVNGVSGWNDSAQRWDVYLNVNTLLPGKGDQINFSNLTLEANGKKVETVVHHASFQDTLFFVIDKKDLPKNVKDGTKVVLKAGKALAGDLSTGIQLTCDFTFYTYKGTLVSKKPTTNTKWQKVAPNGLYSTATFNKDVNGWMFHVKLKEKLQTESGTFYLQLPVQVNGKEHLLKVQQDGEFLLVTIPGDVLSGSTKKATITIPKGAEAVANAGYNGIRFTEKLELYLFNGAISERKFDKVEKTEAKIMGVQTVMGNGVYLRLNTEFPGTAWYERYQGFGYLYNGKKIETELCKSDSSNGRYIYFGIDEVKAGKPKDGDLLQIEKGTVLICGGYEVALTNDFMLKYTDGLWTQFMDTGVKAPQDTASVWELARFDKSYIPLAENGSVLYSNEDEYNVISSEEPQKDFTVSFNMKKVYDDEVTPNFGVILRGNAINEEEQMTKSLLYGYVITFSALEQTPPEDSDEPSTWGGYIQLWKNGENYSLLDQYRVNYTYDSSDHPYFRYGKDYNYQFSIYNVTDTCVCIEAKVNDKLVMRYYDEAGSDPMDPAINAGTFQVFAGCPTYLTDDIVELSEVISEKDTCKVGEKVRVAVTYPSVLDGAEFTVDKEGATIEDGMFVAEKTGTYTISGSYNGKKLATKTITVEESKEAVAKGQTEFPVIPVAAAALLVVVAGIAIGVLLKKGKKKKTEQE